MDLLPETTNQNALQLSEKELRIFLLIADGVKPGKIARKLAKGDKQKEHSYLTKISHLVCSEKGQQFFGMLAQAEMVSGIPVASAALTRKAAAGRVDAIKLLFEATGFHNPRITHDHSGEIKITLEMPRPPIVEDDVQDATVVE